MIEVIFITELPSSLRFSMLDALKNVKGDWFVLLDGKIYERFVYKTEAENLADDLARWFCC